MWNTTQYKDFPLTYTKIIRNAMQTKLALLNYYYTELTMIHEEGGAFYRPLFFDFPDDKNTYVNQTNNIMLGSALKLSIGGDILDEDTSYYYFPEGTWCSVANETGGCVDGPNTYELPSRIYQAFVHIKDGAIIPAQIDLAGHDSNITTTHQTTLTPVDLHIHPTYILSNDTNDTCQASGRLLVDDGEVLDYVGYQNRYTFNFSADCGPGSDAGTLMLNITKDANSTASQIENNINDYLGKVVIYNANDEMLLMNNTYNITVKMNDNSTHPFNKTATFDSETNHTILSMQDMPLPFFNMSTITFTQITY